MITRNLMAMVVPSPTERADAISQLLDRASVYLQEKGYEAIAPEQRQCALDEARMQEALDMIELIDGCCGLPRALREDLDEVLGMASETYQATRGYDDCARGVEKPVESANGHYMRGWNACLNGDEVFP